MKYKNISGLTITTQGVTFKPGDIQDVPGTINSLYFLRVYDDARHEKPSSRSTRGRRVQKPVVSEIKQDIVKEEELAKPNGESEVKEVE